MKKLLNNLWLVVFLFAGSVYGKGNLGVINYQALTEGSKEAKKVGEVINALLSDIKEKLKVREKDLAKVYKEVSSSKDKRTQDKQAKILELQQTSLKLREKNDEVKNELNSFVSKLRTAWHLKFEKAIKAIAKEKGLKVIIASDSCVFRDESIDVTKLVLSKLNADYKEMKIKIPDSIKKLIERL